MHPIAPNRLSGVPRNHGKDCPNDGKKHDRKKLRLPGLCPNHSESDIRRQYRRLSRKHHPDLRGQHQSGDATLLIQLREVHDLLLERQGDVNDDGDVLLSKEQVATTPCHPPNPNHPFRSSLSKLRARNHFLHGGAWLSR